MIDIHCHIGRLKSEELNERYEIPKDAGAEFLHSALETITTIDKVFVTPYATPHVGYEDSLDWLFTETKSYEEIIPVPVLHPQLEVTDILLEKLEPKKVPGIKLHCGSTDFGYSLKDYELIKPLFSFAEKHDLIVFIHTDSHSCFARDLIPFLEEFPVRVVLLHCCRKEGVKLTRFSSVFLETSGCTLEEINFAMKHTPQRIVFGSDFPFFDYDSTLKKIQKNIPQIEENEKVLLHTSHPRN